MTLALAWSLVATLFHWSGPSAVSGFVIAVGVDSVYRVSARRPIAHVRVEIRELAPSLTDSDASSAVQRIVRIGAPLAHSRPTSVRAGLGQAVGCGVCAADFAFQAATTHRVATFQGIHADGQKSSAVTSTFNAHAVEMRCGNGRSNNNQPCESRSDWNRHWRQPRWSQRNVVSGFAGLVASLRRVEVHGANYISNLDIRSHSYAAV